MYVRASGRTGSAWPDALPGHLGQNIKTRPERMYKTKRKLYENEKRSVQVLRAF